MQAVLETAGSLFLEKGFAGTSMDEVARQAGVSKQTVYSYFSSKEQLFAAAIRQKVEERRLDTALAELQTHTLETDLMTVGAVYADLLYSEGAVAVQRILVSEAAKGPELATIFWESGPLEMRARLVDFLKTWVDQGELEIDDLTQAARLFMLLLKGELHFSLTIGLLQQVSPQEIQGQVALAVKAFLKMYQVK